MGDMTLRRWLGGWTLLILALYAGNFALDGPGGWVWVARYLAGFAVVPLVVAALLTFTGQQHLPIVRRYRAPQRP